MDAMSNASNITGDRDDAAAATEIDDALALADGGGVAGDDGGAAAAVMVLEEVAAGAQLLTDQSQQQQHSQQASSNPRCLVCYTDLHKTAATIQPCHHDEICALCHLRLRYLHNDRQCPICKSAHDQIVVDDKYNNSSGKKPKVFEDYPIWGDDLGADYTYNADVGMFFPKRYYETTVQPLFGYHCLVKNCPQSLSTSESGAAKIISSEPDSSGETTTAQPPPLTSLRQLQDHLRTQHRLTLCQLCVDHKRDFVAKLPRYAPSGLQKHLTNPHSGHPVCEFCRPTRFYDITALHHHLAKEHYKCHVCEQPPLELPNQYFASYRSLERHFDSQHFLCHDAQCLTARFVVFGNELDLRHHERHVHGDAAAGGSTKLQLEFRVRRGGNNTAATTAAPPSESDFNYALDGQAFVPAALPSQRRRTSATRSAVTALGDGDPQQLHPQHVQRTNELMEQAARLRQQQGQEASFPALSAAAPASHDATSNTARLTVGWTGNHDATLQRVGQRSTNRAVVTREDFPSLAPAPKPKSSATAKITSATSKKTKAAGWSSSSAAIAAAASANTMTATASNAAASSVSTLTPLGRSSASSAVVRPNNNSAANLAAENFPSLGGSSNATAQRYTAAHALAKKVASAGNKNANQSLQADNFPALSGGGSQKKAAAAPAVTHQKQQPPEWNSAADFPPALSAAPAAPDVSVQDMKAALGTAQYKKLKSLTRDFASADLAPDAFVDHAAALFPHGYADDDFWKFVPALVRSCPNARDNDAALRYMDNLKRLQNGARNAEHQRAVTMTTTNATSVFPTALPAGRIVQPTPYQSAQAPRFGAKKKAPNNAWGSGGAAASVTRAQAAPGSVTAAAARVQPTNTTATSYMAQQSKQEKWQQANTGSTSTKNKKKGKQKNELRSLAFGGP